MSGKAHGTIEAKREVQISRKMKRVWKSIWHLRFLKINKCFLEIMQNTHVCLMNACWLFTFISTVGTNRLTWGCTSWEAGSLIFDESSWCKYCHLSPLWPWVDKIKSGASFLGLDVLLLLRKTKGKKNNQCTKIILHPVFYKWS